jgi:hypothetical protein
MGIGGRGEFRWVVRGRELEDDRGWLTSPHPADWRGIAQAGSRRDHHPARQPSECRNFYITLEGYALEKIG